jgi:2-haloacid dehalogenase
MARVTREVLGDRVPSEAAQDFLEAFAAYRLDEVMGDWKPYRNVVADALRRAINRCGVDGRDADAAQEQITHAVTRLGVPFEEVCTAEQAGAYKPRLAAFEYTLDRLGCGPSDIVHVSSSLRYDLMPAHDLGITDKVHVNRGYEPSAPGHGYREIRDLSELPGLFA